MQSNPTVEHIAKLLYDYTHSQGFPVVRVTVWETPTSFATFGGETTESHMPVTRLAVFDLDGTLIDSRRDLADSANDMLAAYGAPPLGEEQIASMVGSGAPTLVKRVMTAAGVDAPIDEALPRFLAAYDGRLTNHTRPYDGIPGLLEELQTRRTAMALLTNKPLQQSIRILDAFGLSKYFQWVVGGDGPWPRKPAPDGMRYLMQEAAASPGETLLIGDSTIDLQTSRNAGVRICLARYGFGFADLAGNELRGDESIVDTPAEIADCSMHLDSNGWSGEGAFTQVVVDRLGTIREGRRREGRRRACHPVGGRLQLHRQRNLRHVHHRRAI